MNEQEISLEIKKQAWVEATSYKDTIPHEYFVNRWNPKLFIELLRWIILFGRDEIFQIDIYKKRYRYLYLGEYRYWRDEVVMNRVKTKYITQKNGVSTQRMEDKHGIQNRINKY